MKYEDVKVGMRVKTNSEITGCGEGYVRPNDFGTVSDTNGWDNEVRVIWDNPISERGENWWVRASNVEPSYKKSEMVGNYIRVLRDSDGDLDVGRVYQIKKCGGGVEISTSEHSFNVWYYKLPEEFTQADLLGLYNNTCDFQYVLKEDVEKSKPQTKTEPNTKLEEITVPLKVDVTAIQDKPIIEDTDEELIIYCGRHTIYYHKEFDALGTSTCNPVDTYDKYVGKAIAGYRALNK